MVAIALACAGATPAVADSRPPHGGLGGGSYLGLTGADWGPVGVSEYYPGGRFGRYGVRGELRGYEGVGDGHALLGMVYEAAAARPRLQLALHVSVGLSWSEVRPVVATGVQTHLWVIGPLALVAGSDLALRIDGASDTVLAITGTTQLRLAW